MARYNGTILISNNLDPVPTDAQGGYAGGDSAAAAIAQAGAAASTAIATMENMKVAVKALPSTTGPTIAISGTIPTRTITIGVPAGKDGAPGLNGMGYAEGQQLIATNGQTLAAAQAARDEAAQVKADSANILTLAQQAQAAAYAIPDDANEAIVLNTATKTAKAVRDLIPTVSARDYGAKGDGTDQTTALNNALTALHNRGGGFLDISGDIVLSGTGILSRSQNIIITGRPGTRIRPAAGMTGPLFQTSASFLRTRLAFSGITFDLDNRASQGVSINGDHITGQPYFYDCHFRNIGSNGTGILFANTVSPVVEKCTFRNPGAPSGAGITFFRGGRDITVRDCEFHYMRDGLTIAGGTVRGSAPQIRGVSITGCVFEGGWWLLKTRLAGTGTYTATSLTETGTTFTGRGIAALDTVRAMVLRQSGTTTTGSGQQTQLFDTAAQFVTNGVKAGHIIRSAGKWAVVLSVESATKLWHEGWQDNDTYETAYPPAVGSTYTIHEPILGRVTAIADGSLTIQHWHTLDGTVTTPANGTPYEVLVTKGNYPLHTEYGSYNVHVSDNIFRRGWSDQCSIYSNGATIFGNLITDGQDMGITLQGRNCTVYGNIIRHQGAGCIWVEESGHTVHDNELFDAPWQNVTDAMGPLTFWNATNCKGHDNTIHSTDATSATRSKYAVVVRGASPSVELNNNVCIGAFANAHYYYAGVGGTTNVRGRFGSGATFERAGGGTLRGEFRGSGAAPSIPADVGSTYFREDGGDGTTLYVKVTPWTTTTWKAIG